MNDTDTLAAAERRQTTVQSEKAFVSEAISKLHAIALQIPRLAGNNGQRDDRGALKALLRQLYTVICRLSDYRRSEPCAPFLEEDDKEDKKTEENDNRQEDESGEEEVNGNGDKDNDSDYSDDEDGDDDGDDGGFRSGFKNIPGGFELDQILLGGWHAVLEPVDALAKLDRDGPFIAARMILFTQHALSKNKALPKGLSDGQHRFQLQADLGEDLDETLLLQLRTAWEKSGQTDDLSWASTFLEVDNSDSVYNDYNRCIISACSTSEFWAIQKRAEKYIIKNRKRRWESMWDGPWGAPSTKQGPIAVPLFNTLIEEYGYGQFSAMGYRGPCLRRSHYFVQDVQQKLNSAVPEEILGQASSVLHQNVPRELETAIPKYINPSGSADIHHYLSRLDIGAAYTPIPKREADDKEGEDGRISMCKHKGICQGHHSNEEWRVTTKEDVRNCVLDIFESRCHISSLPASAQDWFKAMTTINPHPDSESVGSRVKHSIRMKFPRLGLGRVEADIRYRKEGGLCGLVSSMVHPEVHRQDQNTANPFTYSTNEPGQWAYGRSMHEEKEVTEALFEDVESENESDEEEYSDDALSDVE
ncbi:unnamed protein product [Clonostachys rosea]|uniref:Uncharacterized protein n=1 Tax=Bionectria ochroleuca TaxID=29856 RepID=A0ABY6UEE5_BIOOC|nr:unnamed protein product [Clonostachys rosea]